MRKGGEPPSQGPAFPRRALAGRLVLVLAAAFFFVEFATCKPPSSGDETGGARSPAPPDATSPEASLRGRVLFQSKAQGHWQVFVLDLATRERKGLARSPADDVFPSFSPDGAWIVFESTREGPSAVYRMRADGSAVERLTRGDGECQNPTWAAGGKEILYDCKRDGHDEIHALDLATGRERQVTKSLWRSILPSGSPDGAIIAFTRNELGWDVYRMNAGGSDVGKITSKGGNCRPDWSPDGKQIAYVSDVGDGKGDIWVMAPDGREKRRVTMESDRHDYDPAWSPDGAWIAYQSTTDKQKGPWTLYAVPAAGGAAPVRLSPESGADDRFPDWAE